jgi:hypothetical protein
MTEDEKLDMWLEEDQSYKVWQKRFKGYEFILPAHVKPLLHLVDTLNPAEIDTDNKTVKFNTIAFNLVAFDTKAAAKLIDELDADIVVVTESTQKRFIHEMQWMA